MTISIGVLFSGGGRTVLNLLHCIDRGELDANMTIAIASRDGIAGIDRLADRKLEVAIAKTQGVCNDEGDARVSAWLEEAKPDLICLCGYLRLLEIQPWMHGRVLNIHPSLLPAHGGHDLRQLGLRGPARRRDPGYCDPLRVSQSGHADRPPQLRRGARDAVPLGGARKRQHHLGRGRVQGRRGTARREFTKWAARTTRPEEAPASLAHGDQSEGPPF